MSTNITRHDSHLLTPESREQFRGQKGFTLWFTGLSASGKSTIAVELEHQLIAKRGLAVYCLDGDNIRFGLNKDLDFSPEGRTENIRRIGEVARLFADSNTIALASFISPYKADRQRVRDLHAGVPEPKKEGEKEDPPKRALPFIEVFVDVDIDLAIKRDPKGLYAKALRGEIKHFTGISEDSPYEKPENPEIHIKNDDTMTMESATKQIIDYLEEKGLLPPAPAAAN
ncbi:hypothetical protein FQN49_002784 [Arthroderma sp. PD_2]|nr:hypothetical protein FQN49_002784 [Arthroderma sp. PD_2]